MTSLNLLQLVYTRISHDLSNPAGAVYNGTELLMDDPSGVGETSLLIQNSSQALMARLRFFRQAFGLPFAAPEDATADYLNTLSTPVQMTGACLDSLSKVICMTLADLLIRGGRIDVSDTCITATGKSIKAHPNLKAMLEDGLVSALPIDAPAMYAYAYAKGNKRKLILDTDGNSLTVRIQ